MTKNNIWDINWLKNKALDIHPELIALIKKYSPGKEILEIGYGTGGDLSKLFRLGFSCWGLEKSRVSYNLSRKKANFVSVFGDGENTSFVDGKFDLIFHQGVLEHFKQPHKFMLEQNRILKDNGILIIDVPHKWNLFTIYKKIKMLLGNWYGGWERSYDAEELKHLVMKNGFKPMAIFYRGIFPHQWGKFLFFERIVENVSARKLLTKSPIKYVQKAVKSFYNKSKFLQLISSYNIIIVAKKI
jgi:SAM-dependent methyltransferase